MQKRHKKQQVSRGATPEERLKAIRKSERNGAGAGGGAVETTIHRLSRKKRRRLEVMAGMDQMERDDREASEKEAGWRRSFQDNYYSGDDSDTGAASTKKKNKALKMKDRKALEQERPPKSASVHKADVMNKTAKRSATRRRLRANQVEDRSDISGGGGGGGGGGDCGGSKTKGRRARLEYFSADGEDAISKYAEKDKEEKNKKRGGEKEEGALPFGFTEFDPNRVRMKKKNTPRSGSFKSKAKYKRR